MAARLSLIPSQCLDFVVYFIAVNLVFLLKFLTKSMVLKWLFAKFKSLVGLRSQQKIGFLLYTPFWLTLCLGIVLPYKLYVFVYGGAEDALELVISDIQFVLTQFFLSEFYRVEYLFLGLVSALPAFFIPMILVGKVNGRPIAVYAGRIVLGKTVLFEIIWSDLLCHKSYVGNCFWTYFFTVLGATYTFPSWKMNNLPHTTFLLTHVCYQVPSNMTISSPRFNCSLARAWILALSYFIAYLETSAISNMSEIHGLQRYILFSLAKTVVSVLRICGPSIHVQSRLLVCAMLIPDGFTDIIGDALKYKIMVSNTAIDALVAAKLVTIILDLWRIFLGPTVPIPDSKQCSQPGLP